MVSGCGHPLIQWDWLLAWPVFLMTAKRMVVYQRANLGHKKGLETVSVMVARVKKILMDQVAVKSLMEAEVLPWSVKGHWHASWVVDLSVAGGSYGLELDRRTGQKGT